MLAVLVADVRLIPSVVAEVLATSDSGKLGADRAGDGAVASLRQACSQNCSTGSTSSRTLRGSHVD